MYRKTILGVALALFAWATFTVGMPAAPPADLETPADVIHPNIHDKVGTGANANPNGANANGGQIHGIGNVPGQNADSEPGVDNLANVHGGIAAYNPQVG